MAEEIRIERKTGEVVVHIGSWKTSFIVTNLSDAEYTRRAKGIKAMEDKAAASDDRYA